MKETEHRLPRGVLAAQAPLDQVFFFGQGKAQPVHGSLYRTVARGWTGQPERNHRPSRSKISAGDHSSNVFALLAVSVCGLGWARLEAQYGRALHRPTPPHRPRPPAVQTLRPIPCWDGGSMTRYNKRELRTPY